MDVTHITGHIVGSSSPSPLGCKNMPCMLIPRMSHKVLPSPTRRRSVLIHVGALRSWCCARNKKSMWWVEPATITRLIVDFDVNHQTTGTAGCWMAVTWPPPGLWARKWPWSVYRLFIEILFCLGRDFRFIGKEEKTNRPNLGRILGQFRGGTSERDKKIIRLGVHVLASCGDQGLEPRLTEKNNGSVGFSFLNRNSVGFGRCFAGVGC